MSQKELPLVSVPVYTYNSAKTVIETLDSIKEQTYPNIELIISDDRSMDNTVALCREWIEKNKESFVRTEIVVPEHNTGISANCNRGEAVCAGEWIKGIAGDDLLMPNCIQECMDYVTEHSDTIYLFGRHEAFGASQERCEEVDAYFDYSFFAKTQEEQLHQLIFEGNCVPATTVFYNRWKAQKTGVKNDERIPLLEDWPRWINLLRAGVKFHFVDKILVKYRVGGISTNYRLNAQMYMSERKFCLYYQYPEWFKENPDMAIDRIIKEEMTIYNALIDLEQRNAMLRDSKAYRLGKALLKPFGWLKKK